MYKHVKATNLEGRKKMRKAVTILNVHPSLKKVYSSRDNNSRKSIYLGFDSPFRKIPKNSLPIQVGVGHHAIERHQSINLLPKLYIRKKGKHLLSLWSNKVYLFHSCFWSDDNAQYQIANQIIYLVIIQSVLQHLWF